MRIKEFDRYRVGLAIQNDILILKKYTNSMRADLSAFYARFEIPLVIDVELVKKHAIETQEHIKKRIRTLQKQFRRL